MNITEHSNFVKYDCYLLCELVGGSNLYGLATADSDVDYRGLFVARSPIHMSGLQTISNIVTVAPHDATYYEIGHYMSLLRKSNTQVMEILFAPNSAFKSRSQFMKLIYSHRYQLINSELLKKSLRGYVYDELRLATGERSGRLGGKRKEAVERYGFSPKNFVQILRLCEVGKHFFETGEYVVNATGFGVEFHRLLLDIKTNPENYTRDELEKMVAESFGELNRVMDSSKLHYEYDEKLAAELILEARGL
jgi:hypothetical protein